MDFVRAAFVHLNVWASAWSTLLIAALWVGARERKAALVTALFLGMVLPVNLAFVIQSLPGLYAKLAPVAEYLPLTLFWIPPAALHVACLWTHHQHCAISRNLLVGAYTLGMTGFFAQALGLLDLGPVVDRGWGAMRSGAESRLLFGLQGALLLACFGVSLYWCWESLSEDGVGDERKIGARVWLWGASIFAVGAASNYLAVFGFPAVPIASLGNLVFLAVLLIAVVRQGFLSVDSEIGRLASLVSIAVGSVWLVVSLGFLLVGSDVLSVHWVALEVAAATVGVAVILGYAVTRRFTPTEAGQWKAGVSEFKDLFCFDVARARAATGKKELSELIAKALKGVPALRGVAVYRRSHSGRVYRLDTAIGPHDAFPAAATRSELEAICLPDVRAEKGQADPPRVDRGLSLRSDVESNGGRLQATGALALPIPSLGTEDGYLVVYDPEAFRRWERYALFWSLGCTLAALWYKVGLENQVERFVGSLTAETTGQQQDVGTESAKATENKQLKRTGNPKPRAWKPGVPREVRRKAAEEPPELRSIVGESTALLAAIEQAKKAAHRSYPVILLGETGTGKELFARAIHALSPRADKPFHATNSGAIPLDLAENELFGHNPGAYTGATQTHVGWFEKLSGGTLFLDEIGEAPLNLQIKLLRVVELGEVVRLGSTHTKYVDVRIIAATNRPLLQLVQEGKFREDLFHRLEGFVIELPPLRDRLEDLPMLLAHFLNQCGVVWREEQCSDEMFELMCQYSWPGNVRELRSLVETSVTLTGGFDEEAFQAAVKAKIELRRSTAGKGERTFFVNLARPLSEAVRQYKLTHVQAALELEEGNISAAARLLGMSKSNLVRLLRSLRVNPERLDFNCE